MNTISAVGRQTSGRKTAISEVLEPRVLLSSYDAVKDFSATAPNGSGVWSYGVRYTEFADFAAFPVANGLDFAPNSTIGWNENSGSPPYVGINTTGAELDAEGIDLGTDVLVMHPGGNGEYADLRFTVPQSGDVTVNVDFGGIDTNNTTTDVHVLYNNTAMFDGTINRFGDSVTVEPSLTIANANQGGFIDFVVGDGGNNFFNDATSLSATITTGVSNDHLIFKQQPKDGIVDEPVAMQVEVVNSHNRVDKSVPDGVSLQLNKPVSSTATITNAEFVYVPFVNGIATFSGLQAPFIDTGGTYSLTAVADNSPDEQFGTSGVDTAVSKSFKISGLHLAFTKQPSNTSPNTPIPFSFEVETDANKPATGVQFGTFEVYFFNNTNGNYYDSTQFQLTNAKFSNAQPPTGDALYTLSLPGSYYAGVMCLNPALNNAFDDTNSAIFLASKTFSVFSNHLTFVHQPASAKVGAALSLTVGLRNYKNQTVTLSSVAGDDLLFALNQITGSGIFTVTNSGFVTAGTVTITNFYKGEFNNRALDNTNPLSVTAPGTYTLTVSVLDSDSFQDPDYEPVASKTFKIIG